VPDAPARLPSEADGGPHSSAAAKATGPATGSGSAAMAMNHATAAPA
jgi:hypothetical protein